MSGDIELSIQGVYNRARWWSSSASDFGRLTVLALICRQQDLPKCWCLSTRRHVQEDLYLRSPLSSSLMARQSASRPSLFRNFTSRYPYLLLVSSMLLFSPTTRSPSWCHSISVLVFPEVFFHGILQPSTFRTYPRLPLSHLESSLFAEWVCLPHDQPFSFSTSDCLGTNNWDLGGVFIVTALKKFRFQTVDIY